MNKNISFIVILAIGLFINSVNSQVQNTWETFQPNLNNTQQVIEEPIISAQNASVSEGKTKRTCACDESVVETPVCASNGVTYNSSCRFNCAKARVTRLRVIRKGACSQSTGTSAYWKKGFNG